MYHGIRDDKAEVSFQGRMMRYQIHHILDFDPTRKRMSVVIEDEDGEIYLMVKGAETAVLDRCIYGDVEATEKHIVEYALVSESILNVLNSSVAIQILDHESLAITQCINYKV